MNLWMYCTKPKNDCTCFTIVGIGHSFKLQVTDAHNFRHDTKAKEHCTVAQKAILLKLTV